MDLEIIKIASNTENNNILKNYTFVTKYKSAMCGDELKIYLKVHIEKITKLSYSKGCVYHQYVIMINNRKILGEFDNLKLECRLLIFFS